ncbi:MAG: hypothetical protein WA789_15235 [Candidatus Acidiferrum sp.]
MFRPRHLEGFVHTIAVMQTEDSLKRGAYEQAQDLHGDGIVYFIKPGYAKVRGEIETK